MDDDATVPWLVEHLGLERLPVESTWFRRTYTSATALPDGRAASSAIIGLLAAEPVSRSLLHTVDCDEMWHAYAGDPFRLLLLHPDGSSEEVVLGSDLARGHRVQQLVPAGTWQAAELLDGGRWALFGCTVTPEFTPESFRGAHAADLLDRYPDRRDQILRLSVPDGTPRDLPN